MVRPLTASEVEFAVECLPEEAPIEGNCSAIGTATDRRTRRWIERQLARGNEWAWCTVRVVARWNGFEGDDYLGCCSYRSQADFMHPSGYFPQMKDEALDRLNEVVADHARKLEPLYA